MGAAAVAGAAGGANASTYDPKTNTTNFDVDDIIIINKFLELYWLIRNDLPLPPDKKNSLIQEYRMIANDFTQQATNGGPFLNSQWSTVNRTMSSRKENNPAEHEKFRAQLVANAKKIVSDFKGLIEFKESVNQGVVEDAVNEGLLDTAKSKLQSLYQAEVNSNPNFAKIISKVRQNKSLIDKVINDLKQQQLGQKSKLSSEQIINIIKSDIRSLRESDDPHWDEVEDADRELQTAFTDQGKTAKFGFLTYVIGLGISGVAYAENHSMSGLIIMAVTFIIGWFLEQELKSKKQRTNIATDRRNAAYRNYYNSIGQELPTDIPRQLSKESVNQGVSEEQHSCPHCNGPMFSEMIMNEKKDACYYKVKSRYKVWPSAYASGALVKCRNKGASNWGNGGKKNESSILEGINRADESLHDWFNKEKWVRMDTKGNIKGPCAKEPGEGKPKCLPQSKAHSLGKKGRASAASRKRREDPNPERSGKAINVNTKKQSNESIEEGWRDKIGAAALAGSMALGAAGASADNTRRVTPDGQGGFTGGFKPAATYPVTVPDNTPPVTSSTGPIPTAQAQYDNDTQVLTYKGKQYKWDPKAQSTGQGEVVSAPSMAVGSRSMGPTNVELNPNGTYKKAPVN
jgi:hypothetical protein